MNDIIPCDDFVFFTCCPVLIHLYINVSNQIAMLGQSCLKEYKFFKKITIIEIKSFFDNVLYRYA